jgi:release factor glutamine methyltransferase
MPATRLGPPDPDTLIGARSPVPAALHVATAALHAAGVESARTDAEWLLAGVLGVSRSALGLQARRALEPPDDALYAGLVRRRMAREPLQHIVGTQAFRQITVRVSGDALVPRPETEVLAGWALELLPPPPRRPGVIDVGTGSGCIACALASERPDAEVIAVDASPRAVALARDNVVALGLATRVTVDVSDLFAALGVMEVDVIVSNPPYLATGLIDTLAPEVSRYDPRLALDGGPDGLDVIRRLLGEAPARLVSGGALVLETAGGEQARAVVALMDAHGFVGVETRADLAGVERFVAGRRGACRRDC